MTESRPIILLRKYRSILWASVAVEIVAYIVSLTDSIIAGNLIGIDAFAAISLFSPFLYVSSFVAALVNTGTLVNYTREIGRFDQKRAHEFFSQGMIMAVAAGVLITAVVLLIKPLFMASVPVSPVMKDYLSRYYSIAAFYLLVFPSNCVLNNIIVADGGEKHAARANIACTIGNIASSIILAKPFGVTGIAAATLLSDVIFLILICLWFVRKRNTVRFVWHWSFSDLTDMLKRGIVRASKFISTSLMLQLINMYVLHNFDDVTFRAWSVDQNVLGLSTVFLGIAMTLQPILGTLISERNTKAIRIFVKRLSLDLAVISIVCTLLIWCFTPAVLRIFGVTEGDVISAGVPALRITSLTTVLGAQLVLFFIYYFLLDRKALALTVSLLTDLICPVVLVVLMGTNRHGEPYAIWAGLALANIAAALISAIIVYMHRGESGDSLLDMHRSAEDESLLNTHRSAGNDPLLNMHRSAGNDPLLNMHRNEGNNPLPDMGHRDMDFPLLLPNGFDEKIHIFSFCISPESTSAMSEKAGKLLSEAGFSKRLQSLISMCLEDMLNLISERNGDPSKQIDSSMQEARAKQVTAECTLIIEDSEAEVIIRDDGGRIDILQESMQDYSFQKYIVDCIITTADSRAYIATTGYNRYEMRFAEKKGD